MINVDINKNPNENNISVIKRFTRKVQESGVLPRVRGIRYAERNRSKYVRKKEALARKDRREKNDELIKLGKISPRGVR